VQYILDVVFFRVYLVFVVGMSSVSCINSRLPDVSFEGGGLLVDVYGITQFVKVNFL
jgi:hypothetical protein